jgi:predicted deacylase
MNAEQKYQPDKTMAIMQSPLATKKAEPGRQHIPLEVTRLACGADLRLSLHVLTGHKDGPTLGILTTVHGDETFPLMAVRELLNSIDAKTLVGRIAAIPVANPLAVTVFNRQTPEQHGKTDLHEVFPGSQQGNLTQKLAGAITTNLLDHVDALIDMHCGGLGGRLQSRADLDASANSPVYEQSLKLCRAFNTSFVHANNLAGTAARYCNGRGVPTVNPEIGGVYLGPQVESAYLAETVSGLRSVMAALGMISAPETTQKKQLLFGVKSRFEVNPSVGGFLQSKFASPGDLGRRIEKGEKLGEIIDIHSLAVAEELRATVSGYLFFSRYSGVVDAGTKAFALAEEATSKWL